MWRRNLRKTILICCTKKIWVGVYVSLFSVSDLSTEKANLNCALTTAGCLGHMDRFRCWLELPAVWKLARVKVFETVKEGQGGTDCNCKSKASRRVVADSYLMSFHECFQFLLSSSRTCSGTLLQMRFYGSFLFVFVRFCSSELTKNCVINQMVSRNLKTTFHWPSLYSDQWRSIKIALNVREFKLLSPVLIFL